MSDPLPVFQNPDFERDLNALPPRHRNGIIYELTHLTIDDIKRVKYLKGEYRHLKRIRIGNNRVFLAYCSECYNKHREKLNCSICDEEQLERIVAISIDNRKTAYRRSR